MKHLSLTGLIIFAGYVAASIACLLARQQGAFGAAARARTLWLLIALALAALGINKELDLHMIIIRALRESRMFPGGHEAASLAFTGFLVSAIFAGAVLWTRAFRAFRRSDPEVFHAFLALITLCAVIFLRFAPLEGVSDFLSTHVLGPDDGFWHSHVVELFEFPLVALIAVCAWRFRRRSQTAPTLASMHIYS